MESNKLNDQEEIALLASLFEKGNYEKGLKYSDELINKYPNSPDVFFLNGIINLALSNYTKSIESFTKTLKENKNNADAYNNKGAALFHIGNFKESLEGRTIQGMERRS